MCQHLHYSSCSLRFFVFAAGHAGPWLLPRPGAASLRFVYLYTHQTTVRIGTMILPSVSPSVEVFASIQLARSASALVEAVLYE
jgi:hypothetical protein